METFDNLDALLGELPWVPYHVALTVYVAFSLDYRVDSVREKAIPETYATYYKVGIEDI